MTAPKTSSSDTPARPPRRRPPAATSEAQRRAAVILEVLAGVRTVKEAAAALGICANHYYLLERKALSGLVAACEPQPKGKRADPDKQLATLQRALERSRRECQRQAALVRATQQAVGLPATPPDPKPARSGRRGKEPKTSRRRRAKSVRALQAAQTLSRQALASQEAEAVQRRSPDGDTTVPSPKECRNGT